MKFSLLNTSLESANTGDKIIVQSIINEFPELDGAESISTHKFMSFESLTRATSQDSLIVTGTNFLSSKPWPPAPWRFGPLELLVTIRKVIMLGVGWRKYEGPLSLIQRLVYKIILNPQVPISTRDQYSADLLKSGGFWALNTGCPTMWSLPDELPQLTYETEVVSTVTDYAKNSVIDTLMLTKLAEMFKHVHVWPQSLGDVRYLKTLNLPKNCTVVTGELETFNTLVVGKAYVGTRLHAGIRAAQLGAPALVVSIDNRAREIGSDTLFPMIERSNLENTLEIAVEGLRKKARVRINREEISLYKAALRKFLFAD